MATRITLLNDDDAVWNERDFLTWLKDHITAEGEGFLTVHQQIEHLLNAGFEDGSGSITASDWIGSDPFNAWYGFIEGTCEISFDTVDIDEGLQSLEINQTVNSGAQSSGVRLTANAAPSTTADRRHLIPVKGGKDIRLAFALETSGITSGASGGAQVAIQAYDEDLNATGAEQTTSYVTGTNAFADYQLDVTLPADARYISIELRIDNETGVAFFDDLVLTERGTDMEVTEQNPVTSDLDIATGVCFFEITDGSGNVFMIRFEVETTETVSITNNISGNDRIDVVYAYYDNTVDPNIDADNVGSILVAEGTPAGSPTAPSIPANAIKIAEVYVANGASTFDNSVITDFRKPVTFRNQSQAPSAGADQAVNRKEALAPATEVQLGMVTLEGTPADADRPKVPSMQYTGLLTPEQKTTVLANIPTRDMTLGEDYDYAQLPRVFVFDADTNDAIYDTQWSMQLFTAPSNMDQIGAIRLMFGNDGAYDATLVTIGLYAADGSGEPTGAVLEEWEIYGREICGDQGTDGEWHTFVASSPVAVTAGNQYVIQIEMSGGGSGTNNLRWFRNSASSVSGQTAKDSTNSGSTWSTISGDYVFMLEGNCTDPYAFYLENGENTVYDVNGSLNSVNTDQAVYTTNHRGFNFWTHDWNYLKSTVISLGTSGAFSVAWNVTFALYACDANGEPTGAAIASQTDTATNWGISGNTELEITWDESLTENTQYAVIVSVPSNGDATDHLDYKVTSTREITDGWNKTATLLSTDGGSTWSQSGVKSGFKVRGYLERTQGRVYPLDIRFADRSTLFGFAVNGDAALAGATKEFTYAGVFSGFSGLTAGAEYWLGIDPSLPVARASRPELPDFAQSGIYKISGYTLAGGYIHKMFAESEAGSEVYLGEAYSATEIGAGKTKDQLLAIMDDLDQTRDPNSTTYLYPPMNWKRMVCRVSNTGNLNETDYGEIELQRDSKIEAFYQNEASGTEYSVTFTWDETNKRVQIDYSTGGSGAYGTVKAWCYR